MRETHGRIQGRKGQALRQRRLKRSNYLCEDCRKRGITKLADVVDHIKPLSMGGEDVDENCQALCHDCHDLKTAYESAHSEAASFHPDWLQPSAIPLTIVTGPPCSGKTTHVQQNAKPDDLVIDLDTIMMNLDPKYRHWTNQLESSLLYRAIRVRNALLGSLERRTTGAAWFIISAPSEAERKWWQGKLGGTVLLLHPGVEECNRRAIKRGTPLAREGIERWERSSRMPWMPKESRPKRQTIGADGWPVE